MGLDQYLVCNSKKVTKAVCKDEEPWRVYSGQCAYWRKANQIHKWFVNNVQNGEDDCGTYEVTVEQLRELLENVNKVLDSTRLVGGSVTNGYRVTENGHEPIIEKGKVLEDDTIAKAILPTTSGFFFGSTNYDQWYWADLEYTRDRITAILDAIEEVEYEMFNDFEGTWRDWMPVGERDWVVRFYYHSSW